jgi:hypothetical protein
MKPEVVSKLDVQDQDFHASKNRHCIETLVSWTTSEVIFLDTMSLTLMFWRVYGVSICFG